MNQRPIPILDPAHLQNARLHAVKRLRQRYGVELDVDGLKQIEADLICGHYLWLSCCRHSIAYEVPIAGVRTFPIFSLNLWAIVTFVTVVYGARPAVIGEVR